MNRPSLRALLGSIVSNPVSAPAPVEAAESPATLPEDVDTLFDLEHYQRQLQAAAGALPSADLADKVAAHAHWLAFGLAAGLDPHPLFSVKHYAAESGLTLETMGDPIAHYLQHGRRGGISPCPHFDTSWYLRAHGDVAAAGADPLLHYLRHGAREGRQPNPAFNGKWYASHYADARDFPGGPLVHFVLHGEAERRFRNPLDLAMAQEVHHANAAGKISDEVAGVEASLPPLGTRVEPSPYPAAIMRPDAGLLSFDIWDTVIFRRCHPDAIKLASARKLFIDHRWRLRPAFRNVQALYRQRRAAEDASSQTSDFEYRFADAVKVWLDTALEPGTPARLVEQVRTQLLDHEFAMEDRSSYLNPVFRGFLAARRSSTPLVFASDFYMPSEFLARLLSRKGVGNGYAKVFSSSDTLQNKRSGQLFAKIATEFEVAPADIVHIGDNAHADVEAATAVGVDAVHYVCQAVAADKQRHAAVFDSVVDESLGRWNAELRHLQDLARDAHAGGSHADARRVGIMMAPLAVGFLLHVIEQAKLFGVKTIYFCTREGIFFERVYRALVAADPYLTDYPSSEILEVSRIATFAPSLRAWDQRELMRLWSLYSKQSPQAFLRSLNLNDPWFEQAFTEAGLPLEETIQYPWEDKTFMGVVLADEFKRRAEASIETQRSLLLACLAERGFASDRSPKLIVDIGWRGSIQDNLAHLVGDHIHGCYFGAFKYLNEQPRNSSKSAWLFDFNHQAPWRQDLEVAPVEMLFNGPGGSVASYARAGGKHHAVKVADDQEEAVFEGFTRHAQDAAIDFVAQLSDYVSLTGATASTLIPLARRLFDSLLDDPPKAVAEAFFSLAHNETFGTGGFYTGPSRDSISDLVQQLSGPSLHHAVSQLIAKARWPSALRAISMDQDGWGADASKLRHLPSLLAPTVKLDTAHGQVPPKIGFIIPAPIVGSGGHRTIFSVARKFALRGCEVSCFLESEGDGVGVAHEMLQDARAHVFVGWQQSAAFDAAFATIAHSARFVAAMPNVHHKAYLVQDLEALFNPVGDAYTVAENSYAMGLVHFTIGNWLTHVVSQQYGASGIPAGLGVDTGVYRPLDGVSREDAICFLYQPEKPRRNTQLLVDALRIVKQRRPSVRLIGYGSNAPMPYLDFEVENLGLVRDLSLLNELYNRCAVGVCLSMSNPSRIPFELMAAGAIPVDLYRYNNLFDYDDGTTLLAYQSALSLAEGILSLMAATPEVESRRRACIDFAKSRTSDWETDVIVNSVMSALGRDELVGDPVSIRYRGAAFLAAEDRTPGALAFCQWQRQLATL